MPLQIGTWTVSSAAISQTQLVLSSVDALGNVTASMDGFGPIRGFWDEDGQKILLLATAGTLAIPVILVFTGYMFTDPMNTTGVTGSVIFAIAGEVESFGAANEATSARRSTFGWYAQIGVD